MLLTKMELDITRRQTMIALNTPSVLHALVERSFPGARVRKLWRVDRVNGAYALLILSDDRPQLDAACQSLGFPEKRWETKDYAPLTDRLEKDTSWRFRLVANPTYSVGGNAAQGKRGRVCAHTTTAHQRQWLAKQAPRHGFSLADDQFDVASSTWYRFRKGNLSDDARGSLVTLLAVAYEGILKVSDAALLRAALAEGIGREKAYGMGMLTLMPVSGNG